MTSPLPLQSSISPTKKATLPTVSQANTTFMNNNPQYSMGQPAKNPATGVPKPPNTLPSNQKAPPPAPGNTGMIGSPNNLVTPAPSDAFQQAVGGNLGIGQRGSPEVNAAKDEIARYQQAYANANAGVGLGGTDFNYAQGTEQNLANQYQMGLASRQTALQNALTGQGQQISALGTAGGQAAPTQVSPGNFYINPVTGKDASGKDINPFSGGQRQQLVAQGQDYEKNKGTIAQAQSLTNQFNSMLSANPDFNSDPVNLTNTVVNFWKNNQSNPNNPQLQTALNNILNYYSQVLGKDQLTSLITQAQGQTLTQILSGLDSQATTANEALRLSANSGGQTTGNLTSNSGGGQFSAAAWQ